MHEGASMSAHDTHHRSIPGGEGMQHATCDMQGERNEYHMTCAHYPSRIQTSCHK